MKLTSYDFVNLESYSKYIHKLLLSKNIKFDKWLIPPNIDIVNAHTILQLCGAQHVGNGIALYPPLDEGIGADQTSSVLPGVQCRPIDYRSHLQLDNAFYRSCSTSKRRSCPWPWKCSCKCSQRVSICALTRCAKDRFSIRLSLIGRRYSFRNRRRSCRSSATCPSSRRRSWRSSCRYSTRTGINERWCRCLRTGRCPW